MVLRNSQARLAQYSDLQRFLEFKRAGFVWNRTNFVLLKKPDDQLWSSLDSRALFSPDPRPFRMDYFEVRQTLSAGLRPGSLVPLPALLLDSRVFLPGAQGRTLSLPDVSLPHPGDGSGDRINSKSLRRRFVQKVENSVHRDRLRSAHHYRHFRLLPALRSRRRLLRFQ